MATTLRTTKRITDMKTLVLSGDDCATYQLVDLAIKMGMDAAKIIRETNLVSEATAEYEEEIDPDANEAGWHEEAINYFSETLGIEVINLEECTIWHNNQTDNLVIRVDAAVAKLKEAKKLLGEAL